jgi:O6-methylguanine-DNA--protein-cysteine methyltransferase
MKSEKIDRMAKENTEIEQTLDELEESLFSLREAYIQSRQDEQQQRELRQQKRELRKKGKQEGSKDSKKDPIKLELRSIEQQMADLDNKIASRFVDISIFQDRFWQIVRFTGLGIVIGWFLKTVAG